MEPISASTSPHVVRPLISASSTDLSAVLRDGRVVAGEILQTSADGSLTIAIARQRVPAQTDLRLDPGQRFLFRVQHTADGILLHLYESADPREALLLQALRQVIGQARPLAELFGSLAETLRAELARGPRPDLRALLARMGAEALWTLDPKASLEGLSQNSPLGFEALLFAATRPGGNARFDDLRDNFKARLLRILAELPEGSLRSSVERTLQGIEAEQLLNVARQRSGEAQVWSFLVPDDGGWTTASVRVDSDQREAGDGDTSTNEQSTGRAVLETSFSRVGPVRVEFSWGAGRLRVNLLLADAALVERIAPEMGPLSKALEVSGLRVDVALRCVPASECTGAVRSFDIGFLRDRRILDIAG